MSQGHRTRYIIGAAALGGEFYGHQVQLQAVRNHPWAWVCGQRRMGKTSLLHRVEHDLLAQGGLPLFLSMAYVRDKDDGKKVFAKLLESNTRRLDERPRKAREIESKDFSRLESAERFAKLIERLHEEDSEVAFLFDEAEKLIAVEKNEPGFLRRLYELLQDRHGFRFVLAATQILAQLCRLDGADQFVYQFRWVPLTGLDDEPATHLLQRAQQEAWKPPLAPEVVAEVLRWTGGHPYLLQIVGHELAESGGGGYDAPRAGPDSALACFRKLAAAPGVDLKGIFLDDYQRLTREQQAVLRAACLDRTSAGLTAESVAGAYGLERREIDDAIRFLASYGYITLDEHELIHLRFLFYRDFLPAESAVTSVEARDVEPIQSGTRFHSAQWIVRRAGTPAQLLHTLTAGTKGIGGIPAEKEEPVAELDSLIAPLSNPPNTLESLQQVGERLAQLLLTERVAHILKRLADSTLVIYHDAPSSRIPWEIVRIDGRFLCEAA